MMIIKVKTQYINTVGFNVMRRMVMKIVGVKCPLSNFQRYWDRLMLLLLPKAVDQIFMGGNNSKGRKSWGIQLTPVMSWKSSVFSTSLDTAASGLHTIHARGLWSVRPSDVLAPSALCRAVRRNKER